MTNEADCFDREDAENAQRMIRVLTNELDWRTKRLSIAIQEYDDKIIKLIHVMKRRKEILDAQKSLQEQLLNPLKTFFDKKDTLLRDYNDKLKDRMKQLLHKPQTFDTLTMSEPPADREWRLQVRSILSPQSVTYSPTKVT